MKSVNTLFLALAISISFSIVAMESGKSSALEITSTSSGSATTPDLKMIQIYGATTEHLRDLITGIETSPDEKSSAGTSAEGPTLQVSHTAAMKVFVEKSGTGGFNSTLY